MGGFFGIGNSSAKTDRGRALGGWNAMWDVWGKSMDALQPAQRAEGMINASPTVSGGVGDLDTASDFWRSVLSGDKGATAAAAAPAVNAVNAQAAQKRTEQAQMGTARGGGTAGYNTMPEFERGSNITNAIFGLVPQAAQSLESTGGARAQVGQRELALALQQLGLSEEVAKDIVTTSMSSRTDSQAMSPARIAETAILSMIGL